MFSKRTLKSSSVITSRKVGSDNIVENYEPNSSFRSLRWGLHSSFSSYFHATHDTAVIERFSLREDAAQLTPHGTTILALRFAEGVVMAGDRRATEGFSIANRTIEKVFSADDYSVVAIAGAAGPAIELVRLYQVELEHYEKIEGRRLSLDGKANRLGEMVRQHLPLAMQGLSVVPLFAGYDLSRKAGRIYKFDVTGGRYEDSDFYATGSGGTHARSYIKQNWHENLSRVEALEIVLGALIDAADEDVATGGPDLLRQIYPNISVVTGDGIQTVDDEEIAGIVDRHLASLRVRYTDEG